jgi:nitroreductase
VATRTNAAASVRPSETMRATAWPSAVPGIPAGYPIEQQLRMLVRYAMLAPSIRNSQPWCFQVAATRVLLRADPARWQQVADPDRRELRLSLGCALENLLAAAGCAGFRHAVSYFPDPNDPDLAAAVTFTAGPRLSAAPEITVETLQARGTAHGAFVTRPVAPEVLGRLRGIAGEPGVRLQLSEDAALRREVDVLNIRALGALFGDARYREEFAQAVGSGVMAAPWLTTQLGRVVMPHVSFARRVAQHDSEALLSAPLIGLIGTLSDGPADQLRSGRLLERLWLVATSLGLSFQPMSQALQVPALRELLVARFPEAGQHPQQLVRIGYAAARPHGSTPRRALEDVLARPG